MNRLPGTFQTGISGCPNGNHFRPSCKRRTCPFCGPKWVNNWRTVLRINLEALGRPVVCIAITAPGKDRLPWDRDRCLAKGLHGPQAKCSGKRYGCQVQQRQVREWADTLSWRWTKLRNTARNRCIKAGLAPTIVDRVYEPQKRGAPHMHVVLAYGTPHERRAAQMFADMLAELAPRYDFGFVQTNLRSMTGAEAATYLTSYFVCGSKKKPSIKDTVKSGLMPTSLIWLTPKLTKQTLVTMRMLRRARHAWAYFKGLCPEHAPKWRDMREVVEVAHVFRVAFPGRGPAPPPLPEGAFAFAAQVDEAANTPREVYDGFNTRMIRHRFTEVWRSELDQYAELLIPVAA